MKQKCNKCKLEFNIDHFHKDKSRKLGVSNKCKPCSISLRKEYYINNKKEINNKNAIYQKTYKYTIKARYTQNRGEVIRKGNQHWSITLDQFKKLHIDNTCTYCNLKMPKTYGSGLDRIDCSKGYILDNVVTCCVICNKTKSNIFNYNEMIKIGRVINQIKKDRENGII